MKSEPFFMPQARRAGLVVKEVDGELLVYDCDRDRAHCLNATVYAIWKLCDGRTTIPAIACCVSKSLGVRVGEIVIQLGVRQLKANHLLAEGYEVSSKVADLSRRALVGKLGMGVALLPLITSISAPTALAAVSCSGPCSGAPGRGTCAAGCICSGITNTCVVA